MGTMTKWPVQKHTEHHKTRSIQRRNRHKEITIFCVFRTYLSLRNTPICFKTDSRIPSYFLRTVKLQSVEKTLMYVFVRTLRLMRNPFF